MTRETKIGLLVGLGFIVVFAMLLSHSAPTPPPGDSLQLANLGQQNKPDVMSDGPTGFTISPDPLVTPAVNSAVIESPVPVLVENPTASESDIALGLPAPAALDPAIADSTAPVLPGVPAVVAPVEAAPVTDVLEMTRVAPPLPEPVTPPEPTIRNGAPEPSPQPGDSAPAVPPSMPNATPPKEYIVQKGDTLGHIVKVVYGTGSKKVMDFLMKANKEQIKDRDKLAEGKKLVVPQLPPDLFEPAPSFNVAQLDAARASKMDELINPRRAPIGPKPDLSSEKTLDVTTTTKPSKQAIRVYEVQAKETFSSIAREQLGSESHWREIQKLNKGVDPTKMRPGTKIKLPARRPLSDASGSGRSSA